MEPRRIALAVVLMAAVLILTPFLFPTSTPAPGSTAAAVDSLPDSLRDSAAMRAGAGAGAGASTAAVAGLPLNAAGAASAGAGAGAGAAAGIAGAGDSLMPAAIPVDTTVVKTALADYRTSNRGAALVGATMLRYQALSNRGRTRGGPVELAPSGEQLLTFRLVVPGDTIGLDQQIFRTSTSAAPSGTDPGDANTVRYDTDLTTAAGGARRVSIVYSFLPDSYRVNVTATVSGAPENSFLLVDMPRGFHSSEADTAEDANHLAYAYKPELSGAKGVTFRSLDPGERRIEPGPITWAVAKNKYFLLGVLVPKGEPTSQRPISPVVHEWPRPRRVVRPRWWRR